MILQIFFCVIKQTLVGLGNYKKKKNRKMELKGKKIRGKDQAMARESLTGSPLTDANATIQKKKNKKEIL